MPGVLARQDILIINKPRNLQTQYSLPTKLAGYLSSGTPVLSTDVTDIAQIIKDGESGYIVPPNDPEAMYAKLCYIIDHPEERIRVGLAGQKVARETLNWQKFAPALQWIMFPDSKHLTR
jgi:glycosyltransferase involved in cell wall biosynthesis